MLNHLVKDYPYSSNVLNQRALVLEALKKYTESAEDYLAMHALDTSDIRAYRGLGVIYNALQRYAISAHYLQEGLKLYPDDYYLNVFLGDIYMRSQQFDLCSACYDKISIDSIDVFYANNIGYCKMMEGKYADAVKYFEINLQDFDPETYKELPEHSQITTAYSLNNLGYCYMHTGQYELALEKMETSLSLFPNNPCALINRVKLLERMGNSEKSCRDIKKAIEMNMIEYCGVNINELLRDYCKE